MPQIIASYCHPSQIAASAKVWSGKTLVGTSASVAATARAGLWEFTFASNVPVGWYDIEVFQSTGVAVSNYPVYSDGSSAAIAHNGAAELDSASQVKLDLLLAAAVGVSSQPSATEEKFQFVDGGDAFTTTFDTSGNRASVVLH